MINEEELIISKLAEMRDSIFDDEDCVSEEGYDLTAGYAGSPYEVLCGLERKIIKLKNENEKLKHEPIAVDETEASPSVVEMLGNLAQRIAKLERTLADVKKVTDTEMGARSTNTRRWLEIKDEIDGIRKQNDDEFSTLHTNQKRIAEELETLKYANDELFGRLSHVEADDSNIDLLLTEVADKLAERIYFNFLRAGGNRE